MRSAVFVVEAELFMHRSIVCLTSRLVIARLILSRQYTAFGFVFMVLLLLLLHSSVMAVDDALIVERLNVDTPEELEDIDHRLFASVKSDNELALLTCHKNTSLAMRASWERAIRKAEGRGEGASRWKELRYKTSAAEFLGYLEGRIRVPVPRVFSQSIANIDPKERFGLVFKPDLYLPIRDLGNGILIDQAAQVELVNGSKTLKIRGASVETEIPLEMLRFRDKMNPKIDFSKTGLSLLIKKDVMYVASYDWTGFSYDLTCIDRVSKKVRWKSEVWGRAFGELQGDGFVHIIQLVERNELIYVFGVTQDEIYVEGFKPESGANSLRFSSAY
jgi:hypothetical protein